MAKKTDLGASQEISEFPVLLDEFLQGVNQAEMKRAFQACMKKAGTTGRKTKSEWQSLYELFQCKPVGLPWEIWQTQKGGQ